MTTTIKENFGGQNYRLSSLCKVFFALFFLISPLCLETINAATFRYYGTFEVDGTPPHPTRPLSRHDWIGGIWNVVIEGNLELQATISPDQWIRYYSITSVSFPITYRYQSMKIGYDPFAQPPECITEIYNITLNASNFNLSFNLNDIFANNYNSSFIVESQGIPSLGDYSYQIFLKYNQRQSFTTPKGSTLQLGGGLSGFGGGFEINHFSYLPDAYSFWPSGTGFSVPVGYEDVTIPDPNFNVWCHLLENNSLSTGFSFLGYHDATTKSLSLFQVNTNMVDLKPLAGGLIEFIASDPGGTEFDWGFSGGVKTGNEGGSPAKPIVEFIEPQKYTITLDAVFAGNSLMSQQDIDLSLQPGDLIFIRTKGYTGFFDLINNSYTHVGMYVGNGQMIEASKTADHGSLENGVHLSPISGWAYPTESFATAYRVNLPLEQRQAAVDYATDPTRIGRPYRFPPLSKQKDDNAYYCSELIWDAYRYAAEIDLGGTGIKSIWPVSPDQIAQDSRLTFIAGHWESYPKKLSPMAAINELLLLSLPQH